MNPLQVYEVELFKTFILVFVRFSGLLITAPIYGSANFPARAKLGLGVMIALIVTPTIPAQLTPLPEEMLPFGLYAVGEVLIGMILGFVMTMVFAAVQVAGQIMDMQTGFGMMNVFNPAMETQFPIFGFFFFILAVFYLLLINGHHLMLRALISTFDKVPLGGFVIRPELMLEIAVWGKLLFKDGLMISAPVWVAMTLAYVTMGLLGRVVPQIQLFVVGFPITIATGLLVAALSVGVFLKVLDGMFVTGFKHLDVFIKGMS